MKRLICHAKRGDAWAIILWEWLHLYPHIPLEEVVDVLALVAEAEQQGADAASTRLSIDQSIDSTLDNLSSDVIIRKTIFEILEDSQYKRTHRYAK